MKKEYWEKIVENENVLKLKDLNNIEEKRDFYFKLLREISLPEEEFHYSEVRQKYVHLVRVLEELIKSINSEIKLIDISSNESDEKIHTDIEKYVLESEKLLKEYEELIYFKWNKTWNEEVVVK